MPAAFITRAISGIRASAWPRFIACDSCAISSAGVGVENARGAGIERGVDGEDQHEEQANGEWRMASGLSRAISSIRHSPLTIRYSHYIGRTSTTSGTKCFSRFWMPCCSVAVDDGQPAQEPFMLR